ncbi:YopX family protein [Lentilactobacillus buchneri]|uniref:YopX family protein n=1 Tax=Lentilactobacillus buchneri TaxID=1581 RepID=UPI00145E1C68|nr:YopX family protein [Lentilactobacillus buchneri]
MSREIKFRAWDNETKDLRQYGEISGICLSALNATDWDLEQFTGLKDSNGDDIYENDLVLLDPDDPPYQVIFDEGKFELSNDYLGLVYDLSEEHMDCEIIGRI